MSNLISLLTDFGYQDNFVGVMKAVILKINPKASIVDICHGVKPQDVLEAAFLLRGSFSYFPKGTVHLVVVDPGVGSQRKKLIVKTKDYFFIAADNGVLALTLKDELPEDIIEISKEKYFLKPLSDTFHGRDIFAPVAGYLSKGEDIKKFGRRIESYQKLNLPKVKITAKSLTGEIIYTDRFGNLVSNIDRDTLKNFIDDKKFKLRIKDKTIDKLSRSYTEGIPRKLLALIDSFNYLEIAIKGGSASSYFNVDKGQKIRVERLL